MNKQSYVEPCAEVVYYASADIVSVSAENEGSADQTNFLNLKFQ